MGKITGFMEHERIEEGYKPVEERVKHYKEFVVGLIWFVAMILLAIVVAGLAHYFIPSTFSQRLWTCSAEACGRWRRASRRDGFARRRG